MSANYICLTCKEIFFQTDLNSKGSPEVHLMTKSFICFALRIINLIRHSSILLPLCTIYFFIYINKLKPLQTQEIFQINLHPRGVDLLEQPKKQINSWSNLYSAIKSPQKRKDKLKSLSWCGMLCFK